MDYYSHYDYKEAIEQSMYLLEEADKEEDFYFNYQANRILGFSYQDLNDTIRARNHYEEALNYALKLKNDTILVGAYI